MSKNQSKSLNILKKLTSLSEKFLSCFNADDEKYLIIPTPQSSASNLSFIDINNDNDFIAAPTPQNSAANIKFVEDEVSNVINIVSKKLADRKNSNTEYISKYTSKNVHFAPEPLLTTVIKPKAFNKITTVENELFEYVFGDEFDDLQLLKQTDDDFNDSQLLKQTDDKLEMLAREILGNMEKLMS